MKKVFVMVMVACAMTLASCDGGNSSTSENDSTAVEAAEATEAAVNQDLEDIQGEIEEGIATGQGDAVLSSIEAYKAKIAALIKAGDTATAQKYIDKLKEYVENNKETINSVSEEVSQSATTTLADLANQIAAVPSQVKNAAEDAAEGVVNDAKEAVKSKVDETVENGKQAVSDAVENQKKKVNDAVNEQKQKASDAVNAQQQKANDAINKAASDVKSKLGLK
jgi:gas vesicle protein